MLAVISSTIIINSRKKNPYKNNFMLYINPVR